MTTVIVSFSDPDPMVRVPALSDALASRSRLSSASRFGFISLRLPSPRIISAEPSRPVGGLMVAEAMKCCAGSQPESIDLKRGWAAGQSGGRIFYARASALTQHGSRVMQVYGARHLRRPAGWRTGEGLTAEGLTAATPPRRLALGGGRSLSSTCPGWVRSPGRCGGG